MRKKANSIEISYLEAFEAHNDAIFRFVLYQTSSREVALDITQDTFLKTWEYLQNGHTIDNIRAFLYRIAHNAIIDYRRKKKTDSLDNLIEQGFDYSDPLSEGTLESAQFEDALRMLEHIDLEYRDLIVMRHVEGMSIKEIATITGQSENNISVKIHRGLEKVRTIFKKDETY